MKTKNYSPLYFLAALWPGWMAVGFFMYLMFMTKHSVVEGRTVPVPTFESITLAFSDWNLALKAIIIVALVWIVFFAFKHIQLLIWNIKEFNKLKKSDSFEEFKWGNKAVQVMAYPLTIAMTVNVAFVIWAVFVPKLWTVVEFLFPLALIAFGLIWIFALRIFGSYMTKLFTTHSLDFVKNNNLWQMLAIFAFTMIWVGFAASAAMSHEKITVVLGLLGSTFFMTIAIFFWIIKIILGMKSIFKHWLDKETSPTIWIIIPILTLLWITYIRQSHWLTETFAVHSDKIWSLLFITALGSLQLIFGYIWNKVMKANWYFDEYVNWEKKSPWSFALICPWVALIVFSFFFLHVGLVANWIVPKFGIAYFILLAPIVYLQFITIRTMFKLNKKML